MAILPAISVCLLLAVSMSSAVVSSAQAGNPTTVLHRFASIHGDNPVAPLIQATDGNFYGTTVYGGAHSAGTIFRLQPNGKFTTLHTFDGLDGAHPEAALIQAADGDFYGVTSVGGSSDGDDKVRSFGTFFRLEPDGQFTTLHSFTLADGGLHFTVRDFSVVGLILGSDGNFYGATSGQGETTGSGAGTVFRLTPAGNVTVLYDFNHRIGPVLQGRDGNLYGTTLGGKSGDGTPGGRVTVFRLTLAGERTTIYDFSVTEAPTNPPILQLEASDGSFYGSSGEVGTTGTGAVFRVTTDGSFSVVHSFQNDQDGQSPIGNLIQARDGNLYGIQEYSNPDQGDDSPVYDDVYSLFRLSPAGDFSKIGFSRLLCPIALVQTAGGNLCCTDRGTGFGYTYVGDHQGSIFRLNLDPAGGKD